MGGKAKTERKKMRGFGLNISGRMRRRIRKVASKVSGSDWVQRLISHVVEELQYLQGIGCGGGTMETGEWAAIDEMMKIDGDKKWRIFDVGANVGKYVRLVREHVDEGWYEVHCFEPSESARELLVQVVGDDEDVVVHDFALGKEEGEGMLYADKLGSGMASMTKRKLDHFGMTMGVKERIAIQTLDRYCESMNIEWIDLLKLDVEGHEMDVLEGAKGMLCGGKVGVIAFEFGGCNIDTRSYFQDFYYLFNDLGMDLYRVTPSGKLNKIDVYREIDEQFRTTNYVVIKRKE